MASSIPSFLLPRGVSRTTINLLARNARNGSRPFSNTPSPSASSKAHPDKSRVLEKPDKFRPPSHPSRFVKGTQRRGTIEPRNYPGPKLSAKEVEEKKTRKYPHMFPPEGTIMHRFLTNRGIHVWIVMSVLFSLATFTFTTNFKRTSPYAHLLPSWSSLPFHPIDTISQAVHVYKITTEHETLQTAERRRQKMEDVEKRKAYREAHGLEGEDEDGQRRKRPVKRWFGIWE